MKMLPVSFGNMASGFDRKAAQYMEFYGARHISCSSNWAEPSLRAHATETCALHIFEHTHPTARLLHPIMSLASQSFVQTMQGDPTVRRGCSSRSESCIRSLGSLEMPSPVSTRFVGLQIPIYYRHQCERQTDSDIDPKVVRNADVGGILIENEQIH